MSKQPIYVHIGRLHKTLEIDENLFKANTFTHSYSRLTSFDKRHPERLFEEFKGLVAVSSKFYGVTVLRLPGDDILYFVGNKHLVKKYSDLLKYIYYKVCEQTRRYKVELLAKKAFSDMQVIEFRMECIDLYTKFYNDHAKRDDLLNEDYQAIMKDYIKSVPALRMRAQ